MTVLDHMQKILDKKEKNKTTETGCPLYVLACIATHTNCLDSVEPWYGQIQKLSHGATHWDYPANKAVIIGMYPELKDFIQKFDDKKNSMFAQGVSPKEVDLYMRDKFMRGDFASMGIKLRYDFDKPLTPEQASRVNAGLVAYCKTKIKGDKWMPRPPALLESGNRMAADMTDAGEILSFIGTLDVVHNLFGMNEKEFAERKAEFGEEYKDEFAIADVMRGMQQKGIIDEEGEILNRPAFMQSELMMAFPYKNEKHNLTAKTAFRKDNENVN